MEWVISNAQAHVEPDLAQHRRFPEDEGMYEAGLRCGIRVPLISKGRAIGAFLLWSIQPNVFGSHQQRVLERLAAQIAPAVANAQLYERVERTIETLKSTQEQMIRSERLRAMGELASGVAHDFNNSLALILGRTQLLLDQVGFEPHLRSLKLIEKAARDSAQMVKRILDFSRIHSDIELRPVDVNQLVEDVLELTRHKWSDEANSKGQVIEVEVHRGDTVSAFGSYPELREALTNVMINAYEAISGDGRLSVVTGVSSDQVYIAVSDTGVGMSPELRQKVFDPFFTSKTDGTGLGLSVAYGVVSGQGGTIDIDSEEGIGTTVRIALPISSERETAEEEEPAAPTATKTVNVLVIEDEELLRETLRDILFLDGHSVTLSPNGEAGVSAFQEGEFDVVFTDLGMPGMCGWDVVRAIKQHKSYVPVIMVTGWGVSIGEEQMARTGLDRVLPKPFDIDQVLNIVNELVPLSG